MKQNKLPNKITILEMGEAINYGTINSLYFRKINELIDYLSPTEEGEIDDSTLELARELFTNQKPAPLKESWEEEELAKTVHDWYLSSTRELHPESYNIHAQKTYSELTEEQKFMDRYMAKQILSTLSKAREELLKELAEKVKGMNKICPICLKPFDDYHEDWEGELRCPTKNDYIEANWNEVGYNQALTDILALLSNNQTKE